jgi:2-keto-myo-inositol isomerase
MNIQWALNSATIMNCGWDEELRLWEEFGWRAAEIWFFKVEERIAQGASYEQLARQMRDAGVLPVGMCAGTVSTAFSQPDREQEYASLAQRLDVTAAMGVPSLTVILGGESGDDLEREYSALIEPLHHVAELAQERGLKINFEFLGGLPINGTLGSGIELVNRVDHPALGLLFDFCHYYVSASHLEELQLLQPGKLFMVHVDDAQRRPMETLRNDQRCIPGEGRIPVVTLMRHILQDARYDGYFSVELYDPEIWKEEPRQLLSRLNVSLKEIETQIGDS